MENLNTDSPGHDDISPRILKHCYDTLSIPLTHTITLSLKHSGLSDHLKCAKVIPIHKSEHLQDIKNYSPISILSALSKIYEKIIAIRLNSYLKKIIIIDHQILTWL